MTSAVGRAVALLLVLATISGCATAGQKESQRRSNLLIDADAARELRYVPNWATNIPLARRSSIAHVKVLDDVLVVIERPGGLVTVLSMRDGKLLWRRGIADGGNEVFAPARSGDNILINTSTRLWQFRARDGEVMNAYDLDRVVTTSALVTDEYAIFGGIDGTVFAEALDTGVTRWEYRLTNHFIAPPILVGNNIFVADASGIYAMLSPIDGTLMWRGRTFGAIVAEPAADDANVYIPSREGTVYAVDRNSGRDQWTYRTESDLTLPPKSYNPIVVLPVPGEGVLGIDASSGQEQWTVEDVKTLPVARRGDDVVLAGTDRLMLVDIASGRVRADAKTQQLTAIRSGPDDSLVLVAPDGRVLRLNPTK